MKNLLGILGGIFFLGSVIGCCVWTHMHPMVSVVLLTYNRQSMLPRAVDSILNQTYQNFELIIIDDASTDNTSKILAEYAMKDKRIKIVRNQTNQGIVSNRNKGLELAKGAYIAWQDDDDISDPNRLEEQVDFLRHHQDIILLGTQIRLIGSDKSVYLWPTETDPERAEVAFLIGRLPIILPTGMWRLDFIKENEIFFDKDVPLSEDLVIYDKLLAHGGKMMTLDKDLYQYRLHRTNPKDYYETIGMFQKKIYQDRWNRFFPNIKYPLTACERLKYTKENNPGFHQKVLDDMYLEHCKDPIFNPTTYYHPIIHEDGTEEAVVVSKNTSKFYSNKLSKYGTLLKVEKNRAEVLWDDEKQSVFYKTR